MKNASRCVCVLIATLGTLPALGQDPNNFTGSCPALTNYLYNTGVKDPYGQPHPGADGVTVDEWSIVKWTLTDQKRVKSYSPNVECFSAIVHLKFQFRILTNVITWTPDSPACNPSTCSAAVEAWQLNIQVHELDHKAAYEFLNHSLQASLSNFPVNACVTVFPPRAFHTVAADVAAAYLSDVHTEIEHLLAANKGEHHVIDLTLGSPPNCSACAPCPCPPGQIFLQGQCYKSPCGPIIPPGYYQNCGPSPTNQPIACCSVQSHLVCSPCGTSICPNPDGTCH